MYTKNWVSAVPVALTQPNHVQRPTATVEHSTVRYSDRQMKAFANKALGSSHMVRVPKAVEVPQVHKQPVQLNANGIESNRVDRPRASLLQSRVHSVNGHDEFKGFATKAAGSNATRSSLKVPGIRTATRGG